MSYPRELVEQKRPADLRPKVITDCHAPARKERKGCFKLGVVDLAVVARVHRIKGDEQLEVALQVDQQQPPLLASRHQGLVGERVRCHRPLGRMEGPSDCWCKGLCSASSGFKQAAQPPLDLGERHPAIAVHVAGAHVHVVRIHTSNVVRACV